MSKDQKATVGDFEENIKTLQGAVKENVENGLETYLTLVEQSQKFAKLNPSPLRPNHRHPII